MRTKPITLLLEIFAVLAAGGIMMLFIAGKDSAAYSKGVTDFNEMAGDDFIVGRYVEGTVFNLQDEFAYEEKYRETLGVKHNERVSAHYYVMPLLATMDSDTPQYAAVCLRNAQMIETAEIMVNETWAFYTGTQMPEEWTSMELTGKVSKLDGDLEDLMYEWMMYGDDEAIKEDYEPMICPYLITYNDPSAISSLMTAGAVLLAAGAAGLAVTIVIKVKAGRNAVTESVSAFDGVQLPTADDTGYTSADIKEESGDAEEENSR
ncbi:MAG: hypothetical protein NC120_03350 [Ruminococcus sp.]|nr:hypothetical protein [Ruminococcus sp.]